MMHDDRLRRKSAAGVAVALHFLTFAAAAVALGAQCSPLLAQESQSDTPNADPDNAEPPKRTPRKADDAYSPPADQRTYLQPTDTPRDDSSSGKPWSRPAPGAAEPSYDRSPSASPQNAVMRDVIPAPVEKGDLAPVMSSDGSGLPYELWGGLDVASLEKLISGIEIPPRSPALHDLWKRLITAPSGDSSNADFTALRFEALYRSGLAHDAASELSKQPVDNNPLLLTLAARNELASAHADKACEMVARAAALKGSIPARLKGQAILMAGYCAAVQNDTASAGLAADMAREEGLDTSPGLEALDALSINGKPKFSPVKQISLLDYLIAERVGGLPHKAVLEKGEPALLAALATDPSTPVDLGLPATEAAARLNALTPEALAGIYRANAEVISPEALLSGGGPQGVARRAALFKAAETEHTPIMKTRLIGAFLDDAKHQGLTLIAAEMIAPAAADVRIEPEIGWFAETGIEIGLASGRYDMARNWIALGDDPGGGPQGHGHWRALVDIADPKEPQRGKSLALLESYAVTGRFAPEALHRLATVLEALDYLVPIPLWEAANRTPQPNGGYLPETGVLTELQDASKNQQFGRTVLLVMKALGPNGAEDAHLIALGDSIRALKRAGLEADARRLGLEALLASWPRLETN
jgi:hypothetical protein